MRGQCLCGDVQFELSGPFPALYQCHCQPCRKQGGSASNTGLIIARDQFHWLQGEQQIGQWQKDTGFRSHFCRRCGSPVPNPLRDMPFQWVPAGLLEDDGDLAIAAHIYLGSRAGWDPLPGAGLHHAAMPGFDEFVASLRARHCPP